LAQRLLAQGEAVVDVPAKLAARVRVFDTGNARKTDATDAHAVAMVALRTPRLDQLAFDEELIALRLLTDRRDELSQLRVQTVNRLQRLLTELLPGGAKRDLSALQAKRLLATVKPRTLVGKTMRRMATEEIEDLVAVDAKLKAIKKELRIAVVARGSHLMDLHGIGPAGAARILSDVGDVARFPDRNHFASWTGTAPIDASSGEHVRHQLSLSGREPQAQPCALHSPAGAHRGPGLQPAQAQSGQDLDGSDALPATASVRRRLPPARHRRRSSHGLSQGGVRSGRSGGSGRALGDDSAIQRDRPDPAHRLFGQATSRTRTREATRLEARREPPRSRGQPPTRAAAPEASTWSAPPDERR